MLVFLSDTHLTDQPPLVRKRGTLPSKAFGKFTQYVTGMARNAGAKKLEIVFLGDILDVIRSDQWLTTEVRPWSSGQPAKDQTVAITNAICDNPDNAQSSKYLLDLKNTLVDNNGNPIPVTYTYITGNHDRLINSFGPARLKAAQFLSLTNPQQYGSQPFPVEGFWDKYGVVARHWDVYDDMNFDGATAPSSLGDAIVIELLNKLPEEVKKRVNPVKEARLIQELDEIDNVRPLSDLPAWVEASCEKAADKSAKKKVKDAWNATLDAFLANDFVKKHDKAFHLDAVDGFWWASKLSKLLSLDGIAALPIKRFVPQHDDYTAHAYCEPDLTQDDAEFVVYGHTHDYVLQPLARVGKAPNELNKMYINSGTWRTTHVKTCLQKDCTRFETWSVMTFIAFYLEEEHGDRSFEVWNGALG
jgi:UDP-2,3-diacylglucosamine pyrophosphatase LpxH